MINILILAFSNLKHDARVSRQVDWLRKNYRVSVACFDADDIPNVEVIKIPQNKLTLRVKALMAIALLFKQYSLAYRLFHNYQFLITKFEARNFDLILANDIDTLPLAFQIKGNPKILFDAHEYAPRHFENNAIWRMFFQPFYNALCEQYIPKVDAMLTVGRGLAKEYEKNFGIKPIIITNATKFASITASSVSNDSIKLIHHGIANQSRRLELMIEMMKHLDERFTLDLILMTSDYASPKTRAYIKSLKEEAAKNPRIKILPPVKSSEVVPTINKYDIGVFLIPPVNFNYANTLPNKLFDFIQARLAIAIGPTPEMAEIVREYDIGVVSPDFTPESLAKVLNNLANRTISQFKLNANIAAQNLNAEKNETIVNSLLVKLLKD